MPVPRLELTSRVWLAAVLALCSSVAAQDPPWRGGTSFEYRRTVELISGGTPPSMVVTELFTHGDPWPDAANLVVFDRNGPVPRRVLQIGPGDFCRVAFIPTARQTIFQIYYGGDSSGKTDWPAWPSTPGLVLDTRRWKKCDLNSVDSVRAAFESAEPIGSDFVPHVFHRADPFAAGPAPFLSRYRGTLQIDRAGKYKFFTSSQDASFLLIDGRQVVAAPGHHGPVHQAKISGEVSLSAGPHEFEYLHAASGNDACMVAAWQPPGTDNPVVIPPEAFGASSVAHVASSRLQHRTKGNLPDFTIDIAGEVPLVDSEEPLVRVQFKDAAVKAVTMGAKVQWDFGDGQSSDQLNPTNVYLHPGQFTVKMSVHRGVKPLEVVSRVQVRRPLQPDDGKHKPDQLADYLPLLADYDPRTLGGPGLVQLVRAFDQADKTSDAVRAGRVAFQSGAASYDDSVLHDLARLVGPMIRDRQDNPTGAMEVWQAAAGLIRREAWKAECAIEAADICLSDLLRPSEAKPLLESAQARLKGEDDPNLTSRLDRLWGDWHAFDGDGAAARAAYQRAAVSVAARHSATERNAWRGAYSRSIEAFLRDRELPRVRDELRRWESEFPADKVEGYLPLLVARYFAEAKKYDRVVAIVDNLLTVNRASPYADQLVFLAAECEGKLGHSDRAVSRFQLLIAEYPGSPLIDSARTRVSELPRSRAKTRP